MGGGTALLQRQGWNGWRFLRRRHADADGDCTSAAPGWYLPGGDREQLSRRVDVSGGSFRAMVQRVMDVRSCPGHAEPFRSQKHKRTGRHVDAPADELPAFSVTRLGVGCGINSFAGSVLRRMAGSSQL